MLEGLFGYLTTRTLTQLARDVLDVGVVYYVFYRALLVLRGTRAMQVGIGLAMVFLLYVVAQLLQLVTLLSIMGALISSVILVIVVVFQNDIRRGLQRVGSRAWFAGIAREREFEVIDKVVDAATDLARHRIGALIAFEQDANLDEFVGVHKGHPIDAAVSRELLVSLFIPESMNKLHDGAVIIRNLRVAKAGVFFPMPETRVVDESFGSRHRAALGITEETDAVVVIVSEERGTISFCFNGNIATNLDGPKLRTMLEAIFSPKVRKKTRRLAARRSVAPTPALPEAEVPRPEAAVESRVHLRTPELHLRPSDETPRSSKPTEAPASLRAGRPVEEHPQPLRPRPPTEEALTTVTGKQPPVRLMTPARPLTAPVLGPGGELQPPSHEDEVAKRDDERSDDGSDRRDN
jgi:uncharacterized protein (TIGR00159 family)